MLRLRLECSGPEGPNNGCPEGLAPFETTSHDGQDQLRVAFSGLVREAEAKGWGRGRDNAIRCCACLKASAAPREVAGIAMERWDEAFARLAAGEPPSAWSGKDGLPTAAQFHNAVNRLPEFRARWEATPAFKGGRKPKSAPLPEDRWPLVLARFQAGETKDAICTGEEGLWPTPKMWNGRMGRDIAFREAVNAEHARRAQIAADFIDWDAALQKFAGGATLASFRDQPGMPNPNRWWKRWTTDEAFRARATEAMKARPRKAEERYRAVIALRRDGLTLAEACEAAAISVTAVINRRRDDPHFAGALAASIQHAKANQMARPIERLPRAIRERPRYVRRPVDPAVQARRAAEREAARLAREAERAANREALAALKAEDRARRAAEREAERASRPKPQRPPASPTVPYRERPVGWGEGQRKPRIVRDRPKLPTTQAHPKAPERIRTAPVARPCPPRVLAAARDLVAERMHVPAGDLTGKRGGADVTLARFVFRYLIVVEMDASQSAFAAQIGTDPSTIAHGLAQIEDRRDDPEFDALMDDLAAELRDRLDSAEADAQAA
jgi:hypothetical protein